MNAENKQGLFFNTYRRLPLEIERAEGMYLHAKDGTRYLDMFAGIGVTALGHSHPGIVRAIADQTARHLHLSNYFTQDAQVELADTLLRHSGYRNLFLTNSGTEAVEGAIKIARRHGTAAGKREIVAFSNSFHGRTYGPLSLMDRPSHREGFGPFLDGCRILPFNDHAALLEGITADVGALFLEFIQGEGGIHPAEPSFVRSVETLRSRFGFLLVADEIQSGLGRTGSLFAFEQYGIRPDVVVLAKALGGGLPLGAILGNERVREVLQPGSHGSTFGGNAAACAAGTVVLRALAEHGILENVTQMGELLKAKLGMLKEDFPHLITDIRGRGLMIGIELKSDADQVALALMNRNILVNVTAGSVLRILPPLIIRREEVDRFMEGLQAVLTELSETIPQLGEDGEW